MAKDGTVYAGSGDGDYYPERQIYGQAIIGVKQNPEIKALERKDWYAPWNAFWLRKRDLDMTVKRGQTGVRPGSDRGHSGVKPASDPGLTPLRPRPPPH